MFMSALVEKACHELKVSKLATWPRGVTASTLDSESSDRGSNPREASFFSSSDAFGLCSSGLSMFERL